MRATRLLASAVVLSAACGLASPGGPAPPPEPSWQRIVYGVSVSDQAGVPVDHPFLGGFNLPRPQLADADGDGDFDLFVQEATDRVMFFENIGPAEGSGPYRWITDHLGELSVGEWFRFADLDLDGDLDLLAEAPFSYIRYYRNDGGPLASAFVLAADTLRDADGEPIFSDRQNIPNAADIDCDDRVDLLIGRLTGVITRYEATRADVDGVPVFAHATDSFEDIEIVAAMAGGSRHGANTMALGDVDHDGDLDLFWGDFFEPGLLFIENTGTCAHPSLRGAPRPFPPHDPVRTSGYNAPTLGDADLDGDLDLVMGVLGGAFNPNSTMVENLYLFAQQDGVFSPVTSRLIRTLDVGSESLPALADLDEDGDLDLLVSNKIEPENARTGALFVFENTGTATAPAFAARGPAPGLPEGYHYAPAFGDLDADGDLDVLLGSWRDRIAYYRNDGPARPDESGVMPTLTLVDSAVATLTRGRNATPALADMDGDGDLDLFVGEASGALNYYRNDGGPAAPVFRLVSDEFQGIDPGRRSVPAVLDMDGDGDWDLVIGSEAGELRVYVNEGSRFEPLFVETGPLGPDAPGFAAPAFGDLDADGDLDLVAGGVGGGLALWRRTGRTGLPRSAVERETASNGRPR